MLQKMKMSQSSSPAQAFAATLLAAFAKAGVRNFFLAPGARSQALAIAAGQLADAKKIDLHVRLDERSMAFTALGAALGLSWAQGTAMQIDPQDPWERLLVAGLARDFQTMRLDFLRRRAAKKPLEDAQDWLQKNAVRVRAFKAMVDRARMTGMPTPAMLAQVAGQARVLLGR